LNAFTASGASPSHPPSITKPETREHATFLGAPVGDLEDLAPGDIALAGLFMEHGDPSGFGARFAARQIRYASRPAYGMAPGPRPPSGRIAGRGRLFDVGDLNVFPLEPERQRAALERQLTALLATGACAVVVGGAMCLHEIAATAAARLHGSRTLRAVVLRAEACTAPLPDAGDLFVTVDVAGLFAAAPAPRPKARLLEAIRSLPAHRVRAAHLCGLAPDLDLSGRHDTAAATLMLAALVRHLGAEAR
jgi:arginase family enzyme